MLQRTFSLLSHKDGDGKVDLKDLLRTLGMIPDIISQPLTLTAEHSGLERDAGPKAGEMGSTSAVARPTVADEMRFASDLCRTCVLA